MKMEITMTISTNKNKTKMTIKQQALKDMTSEGIIVSFVYQEKAILELVSEDISIRIDFRRFNGGHCDKRSLLLIDCYSEEDV